MTWATWAATLVGAKPVYLYQIEKDGEAAYYTSRFSTYSALPATMELDIFDFADFFAQVDFFRADFSERPIGHSAIRSSSNSAKRLVTITLPRTDAFAQKFIGELGIATTKISIWKGYENDPDQEFPRIFTGEIRLVKPTWLTVSLICEDSGLIIKGKGIADVIQRPCRHALYFGKCTLALADWQTTGSATAMSSGIVTVTEAALEADGYYAGGIISYGGALQLITEHTGTALTVLGAVGDLESDISGSGTQSVEIAKGCNRSMTDCISFDNDDNFGGFKELTDSPFDGRSVT